jgi:ABC-2 type transport system ATP-binding protein
MSENAVRVQNLSVLLGRKVHALKSVSLELPEGKVVGFIGPSGAGKTTLIRSIVGRQKLTRGQVTVLGLPAGSPKLRSQVSYMTQETAVYPDLTVRENLHYFATMSGIKQRDVRRRTNDIMITVDLTPQADQLVSTLSGGQKQRVSLAVALIGAPKLMVLDEPTVGLDPVLRDKLWRMFAELAKRGTTLIISSHAMEEAERCEDLVLIRNGKVVAHSSPANLLSETGTKTVEASFLKLVGDKE